MNPEAIVSDAELGKLAKLDGVKSQLREAIAISLGATKDIENPFRYATIRPIKAIFRGGPEESREVESSAARVIGDFCQKMSLSMPTSVQELEALLSQIESSELDQQISETM